MINASVMPITREQKRQRRRLTVIEKRVDDVEEKVDAALKVGELVERVLTESVARIELKIDRQHADLVQRMSMAEGWIGRRKRMEKTLLRVSQLAIVGAARKWLPFFGMLSLVLVMWWVLVSLMGSGM
jgi:hypothetical protein